MIREIINDFRSDKLISAIFTGGINGILLVIVAVSFAAMIFSGEMGSFATRAAGLILFGCVAMGGSVLMLSGLRTHVALPQDAPSATLVGAVPAVAALLSVNPESAFMSLVAILFFASLLTGLLFLFIGRYQLGNLFRFIPYPVVGGFLAGSGWLLFLGGISVMCGNFPSLGNLGIFFTASLVVKWGPGLALALFLFVILQRFSHFLVLPGALLIGGLAYYCYFYLFGLSPAEARQLGFLISGLPESGLWPVFHWDSLAYIHWDIVLRQLPLACSAALVSILGTLLNLSGIEVGAEKDVDLNREFKALAAGNLTGALGGSTPGYTALSLSLLGIKMKAETRICGLVSTVLVALVLFLGGNLLTFFPKPLLGALLALLGLFFLWEWVVQSIKQMPLPDYLLILLITLIVVWNGFLFGVAAGLAITLFIFVFRFSRVSIISRCFTLSEALSQKQRSIPDRHLLSKAGQNAIGYELSGYLFFGSASSFVEKVRGSLEESTRILLLDFRMVSGVDISAIHNFQRLLQATSKANIRVYLSASPKSLIKSLGDEFGALNACCTPDMGTAIEAAEDLLLAEAHQQLKSGTGMARDELFDLSVDDLLKQLERQEYCESLLERLAPWVVRVPFKAGEEVLTIHQQLPGVCIMLSGTLTERDENRRTVQQLSSGHVLYPQAQFVTTSADSSMVADVGGEMAQLSPAMREELETTQPALALELDRYILTQQC